MKGKLSGFIHALGARRALGGPWGRTEYSLGVYSLFPRGRTELTNRHYGESVVKEGLNSA